MSKSWNEQGRSAFPVSDETDPVDYGMSLRDYFAGQALTGLLAGDRESFSSLPARAYQIADAMLAERMREKTK